MFSQDLKLNQFVCSIPICQPEADLGSLLQIFEQTNSDCIAIPGKNHNWGTISSQSLVAWLAKSWQQTPVAMVSHPKRTPHQRHLGSNTITSIKDFQNLLKPAIIYPGETSLAEFLPSLERYFQTSQDNYLILDSAGQLQGKLDKDKLLRYLGSRFNQSPSYHQLPITSIRWFSWIDDLPFPVKLETTDPENYYLNQSWQKLVSRSQDKLAQSAKSNAYLANWWTQKQFDALSYSLIRQNQHTSQTQNSTANFCYLEDKYYLKSQPNLLSKEITEHLEKSQLLEKSLSDDSEEEYLSDDGESSVTEDSSLGIQIEQGIEWSYLRIPLTWEKKQLSPPQTKSWLVLAIQPSLLKSPEQPQDSASLTTRSTVDRLLATMSHELKSPLTGIVGLSNLLNSQKLGELNHKQNLYVSLIHNSGQKLMTIVNDLLELTSLTTGKLELKTEAIDLEPWLHQLYHQAIAKFQAINSTESNLLISTFSLKLDLASGWEVAIADRLRLANILVHLISETIQFCDRSCDSSPITLKIEVKNLVGRAAIMVRNEQDVLNTSNPSAQENDLETISQSVGLNLIIAQYLAEMLQGEIKSVYSSQGCSFTLLLPTVALKPDFADSTSPPTSTEEHPTQKNLTILCLYPELELIDPKLGNNHGLDFSLKTWAEQDWSYDLQQQSDYRHRIIEADGLEQAHTLARIWQLDVIVLDGYQISDADQYLRSLQESEYLSALPLITLDTKTTEAANQIEGLNVYPCLLPHECRSIKDLMQVIQIATGI
jgi:signal transduction histidine kinase